MTLTVGLARSEMTMACRCSCEIESSSQSGSTLQQFSSSSSSTCSVPWSPPAVCPASGHLASSSSTSCTFFAISAIFGDWHAKFWMFVFWEKLLPLLSKKKSYFQRGKTPFKPISLVQTKRQDSFGKLQGYVAAVWTGPSQLNLSQLILCLQLSLSNHQWLVLNARLICTRSRSACDIPLWHVT